MKGLTQRIIDCRQTGMSYNEIVTALGCSKSSVSLACQRVPNNDHLRAALWSVESTRPGRSAKARIAAHNYYAERKTEAVAKWAALLHAYPDQGFIRYIAGLYDGEGRHSAETFSLANSDPALVRVFLRFLEEVCRVQPKAVALNLHATHDTDSCRQWWLEQGVAISVVYQIDQRPQKRDYAAKENYGTVSIRVEKPLGLYEALQSFSYAYSA